MALTTVKTSMDAGVEGGRATYADGDMIVGRQNKAATTIPYGRAVMLDLGNGDDCVTLPSSSSDVIEGITVADGNQPYPATGVPQYGTVSVMKEGTVYVYPEESVSKGDPVYVRFTAGAGALTVGRLRKSSGSTGAGTKRKQTLTISGALDGGLSRIQKLVLSDDLVADDQVDGAINGTAIAATTYATSHIATMAAIVLAIKNAAESWADTNNTDSPLQDVFITGATSREIHIVSRYNGATTCALTLFAVTHGGAGTAVFSSATGADVQAGFEPHSLSIQLDGAAALVAEWRGTSDATLEAFADLIAQQTGVESAVVTHLTDTGGGIDNNDRVITVTAATPSATANAFTNPTVAGGQTARTLAVAETVAGVAAGTAIAVLLPNTRWAESGSSDTPVAMSLDLLP